MASKDYSYILLAIQIPARTQSGVARVQNTENLLEKMSSSGKPVPPIIIVSDYFVECDLEKMVDVMRMSYWRIMNRHHERKYDTAENIMRIAMMKNMLRYLSRPATTEKAAA